MILKWEQASPHPLIPAKAGTQGRRALKSETMALDSRLQRE
jgi:hypothetical protein